MELIDILKKTLIDMGIINRGECFSLDEKLVYLGIDSIVLMELIIEIEGQLNISIELDNISSKKYQDLSIEILLNSINKSISNSHE